MKILAVGGHPDDLEYGCGGTLSRLSKKGHEINLLIMTDGSQGGDSAVRRKEQEAVAKILGAKLDWGGFQDTCVPMAKHTIDVVEAQIKKISPDLIFVMHPNDTHQDHRSASQSVRTAARYVNNVLFYEVPSTVDFTPASVYVDITNNIDEKLKLLETHASQVYATRVADLTILEAAKSTSLFRGFQNHVKYAEAFVPLRVSLDRIYEF
jgi:LmbE family N-acetylglucosaminyl deacetylase